MAKKDKSVLAIESEIKGVARAVGASLKRAGHGVPHSVLLHALAAALDKRDWHKLKAALAPVEPNARKSAGDAPDAAVAARYHPQTMFWLKLAFLLGRPVWPVPRVDWSALEQARSVATRALNATLLVVRVTDTSTGGCHVPAVLALPSLTIDVGTCPPSGPDGSSSLQMRLSGYEFVLDAAHSPDRGWHVSPKGEAQFAEQVNRMVSDDIVLKHANGDAETDGPEVKARFWTDDHVHEVTFDARPYLVQASVEALLGIAEVGFVGDSRTDSVAEYLADRRLNEDLVEAFEYLRALQKARLRKPIGFECEVDAEGFYRWMDAHYRAEIAAWLCTRDGVEFVQAEEKEIRGMWDWLDSAGNACEHSFSTREEAVLDAYETLGLLDQAIEVL